MRESRTAQLLALVAIAFLVGGALGIVMLPLEEAHATPLCSQTVCQGTSCEFSSWGWYNCWPWHGGGCDTTTCPL